MMAPSKMTIKYQLFGIYVEFSGGVHTNKYHNLFGEDLDWELFFFGGFPNHKQVFLFKS